MCIETTNSNTQSLEDSAHDLVLRKSPKQLEFLDLDPAPGYDNSWNHHMSKTHTC